MRLGKTADRPLSYLYAMLSGRVIALLLSFAGAQGLKYTTDIEAAFREAQKTRKPLWVMVAATWCGPCRWTEAQVLSRPWLDSLIRPHFVPLKIYAASGENNTPGSEALAKRYQVRAFPTFLFLYPNGELFYRMEGAPMGKDGDAPEVYQKWQDIVKAALSYQAELPRLQKKFEKGDRTPELVRRYFLWALSAGDSVTLHETWEAYLQAFPSPRMAWLYEPQAYKYLQAAALRLPAAQIYALHIADTLQNLLPSKTWTEIYEPLIETYLVQYLQSEITQLKAQSSPDPLLQAAENTLHYARTLQERFPFAEPLALEQISDLLLQSEKDNHHTQGFLYASQYIALIKSIGPPDAEEREKLANSLNNMAWHIYEHLNDPVALWAAIAWTKDALSYKPDAWYIWDTLGALYYKLKRKKEAITALSKAIEIAKSQKIPEKQYQETEELLQKAQESE